MARRTYHDHSGEVYRVFIASKGRDTGTTYETTFGPYATLSAARGILTAELGRPWLGDATGHIEGAVTVWEVVEAPTETDKAAFEVTAAAADSLMGIFGYKRATK